jgi:hypothetical protein
MRPLVLPIVAIPSIAQTEDARLARIRDLLVPLRADPLANLVTRGATPVFTTIKHEFRDWIENRLEVLKWKGSTGRLQPSD